MGGLQGFWKNLIVKWGGVKINGGGWEQNIKEKRRK